MEGLQETPIFSRRTDFDQLHKSLEAVSSQIYKVIAGQHESVDLLMTALLSGGHVLIEGVPGIAKTLTAKLLARSLSIPFSRIQFTPDLMPSDVLGTSVFRAGSGEFEFRRGPVFSNIILIDEINRAPAKTQAALFEVMEERQVTIDGHTYPMDEPFMVMATQNPIEQEGTYRLPEAQLDRFLFKIVVKYPELDDEIEIVNRHHTRLSDDFVGLVEPVLNAGAIMALREQTRRIQIEESLIRFIARITMATREHAGIYLGASPRASISMLNASKAWSAMKGRDFVTPDDILFLAPHILRHRLILNPEKEMEGTGSDQIIKEILQGIEVPR